VLNLRGCRTRGQLSGLEHDLSEVALALFAPGTVDSVLQRIVDEATDTIEGCDLAGILLLQGGLVTTSASSDPLLIELHRLQVEFGEGPCLDVAAGEANIYAVDLAVDEPEPSAFAGRKVLVAGDGTERRLAEEVPPERAAHVALWAGSVGDPHGREPHEGLLCIDVGTVLAALEGLDRTRGRPPQPT
jgi:hypothetical protein